METLYYLREDKSTFAIHQLGRATFGIVCERTFSDFSLARMEREARSTGYSQTLENEAARFWVEKEGMR